VLYLNPMMNKKPTRAEISNVMSEMGRKSNKKQASDPNYKAEMKRRADIGWIKRRAIIVAKDMPKKLKNSAK